MASGGDAHTATPPNGTVPSDAGDATRPPATLGESVPAGARYQRQQGSSTTQLGSPFVDLSRYHAARQPINDAVTSAFTTDASSTASLSPDVLQHVISQITANVLQQLKAANFSLPTQTSQASSVVMDANSSTAGSPPVERATVYTPPSPHRLSEDAGPVPASPHFPPVTPNKSSHANASPRPPERHTISPVSSVGLGSDAEDNPGRPPMRPKPLQRVSTDGEATTLERIWGLLFDERAQATPRLGQFLRGIAVHLIEDYDPKHSLVITPAKMQRYYEETKLADELYPWKVIFDDRTSSISRMFRELEAQHHLVQERLHARPDIPGLTPQGFATWATMLLKAHPEQEFERLAKTALDMPISNPDDRKERFPKELSRRLFPSQPNADLAAKLQKAMSAHCNVSFTTTRAMSTSEAPARASQAPQDADGAGARTTLRPSREKLAPGVGVAHPSPGMPPPSHRSSSEGLGHGAEARSAEDDQDDTPTPQPIERERKPYVAAPGGGKSYDVDKPAATEMKPPPPPPDSKFAPSNSVSTASRSRDRSMSGANGAAIHQRVPPSPMDIPDARHHRANSTYHRDAPRPGRNRSPSISKEGGERGGGAFPYGRRADADAPYSSSHHSYTGTDPYEDARRYREYEAHRERLANDRYDAARMAAYDPREREREREARGRLHSSSAYETPPVGLGRGPSQYTTPNPNTDDDYYRERAHPPVSSAYSTPSSLSTGFQPPPNLVGREPGSMTRDAAYAPYPPTPAYPPSSYRDSR